MDNESIDFTSDGQFIAACGTTRHDHTSQFSQPQGIDIDNSDHVYVTDKGNDRIEVFVLGAGFAAYQNQTCLIAGWSILREPFGSSRFHFVAVSLHFHVTNVFC